MKSRWKLLFGIIFWTIEDEYIEPDQKGKRNEPR